MRLGQIARKLDITPAELGAFLQEQFGVYEWGTNSRLSEAQLAAVLRHFAPDQANTFFQNTKVEEPQPPAAPSPVEPVALPSKNPPDVRAETRPEGVDVIKAPKVELSGLKVLGKIELPEKKKKEPVSDGGENPIDGHVPTGRPARRKSPGREERPQPHSNPIALQREREEREALRKKQEEAKRLKEKKAKRYFKTVQQKPVKVTKAARIVEEEVEVMTPHLERPEPKTWWGRFLRWLNT